MNVLVVDVGGTHVKVLASGQSEPRKFDSGPDLVPGKHGAAGSRRLQATGTTTSYRSAIPDQCSIIGR